MRHALIAIALLSTSASQAPTEQPQALLGWWRATLTHDGESQDVWLHIHDKRGKLIAGFSNPAIGIDDTPLSEVSITSEKVELTSIGWVLRRDGQRLTGTIPKELVPVYSLEARFVRSGAPPRAVVPRPTKAVPPAIWMRSLGSPIYAGLAFDPRHKLVIVGTDSGRVAALTWRGGAIAWSIEAGSLIRATPLVAGNALFVASDKALLKLDLGSGKRFWSAPLNEGKAPRLEISDPNSRWDHYASSPFVSGKSVCVGSRDGCVYRFSIASGAKPGRYCATDMITATPVVEGSRLYFASFDGSVHAVDLATGDTIWTRDLKGPVPRDLAIADGNILAGSRSYDLVALDKNNGRLKWNRYYWFSWVDSPPSISGQTIYIGSSDGLRLYALEAKTGKKLWESRVPGWAWAKPAIGRHHIYASITGTTMPYVGSRSGGLAAIDRRNGMLSWLIEPARPKTASTYGFASAPFVVEGRVIAADLNGIVYNFPED